MQQDQIPLLLGLNHKLFPGNEEFGHGKKEDSYKLLIVGDSGVGKTNLLNRVMDRKFQIEHYPTKGVNQGFLNLKIGNDIHKVVVWDTAGTQGFGGNWIKQQNPRGAVCVFLTYDITRKESLDNVAEWLDQAQISAAGKNMVKYYLIGTKRDLKGERQVEFEHAVAFAKHHKIHKVFETSAREDFKIKPSFLCATNDIVKPNMVEDDGKDIYKDPDHLLEARTQFHQTRNDVTRFKEGPSNYILDQTRKGQRRVDAAVT